MIENYDKIKQISEIYNVPGRINLYTRANQCETVLDLVGCVIHEDYSAENEFNYRISASYPYILDGEKDNYIAIDFSEGPKLYIGDTIGRMKIIEICPPIIVCTKK